MLYGTAVYIILRIWPVTIVETREFLRQAAATFSAEELEALKLYLAVNATAGVVIPGSGGIRKLRWGAGGKGKRGGARGIYYFHSEAMPLFLLSAYSKTRRGFEPSRPKRFETACAHTDCELSRRNPE